MDDYRSILKHVGWVLIVVGILDICNMAYYLANRSSYMPAFTIFAVAAGTFLIRGNLRAARLVTYCSGFLLTGALGMRILARMTATAPLLPTPSLEKMRKFCERMLELGFSFSANGNNCIASDGRKLTGRTCRPTRPVGGAARRARNHPV